MKIRAILFDMDGTLIRSGEGIVNSIAYALKKMGRPEYNTEELKPFIGPPLIESLTKRCGFSESEARRTVGYYRERYAVKGLFESEPYPGIDSMLEKLKEKGCILAVASAKPEPYVMKILEHFSLNRYFDVAVGATMQEERTKKEDVIEEALNRLKMKQQRGSVVMVGDKGLDVKGAKKAGIACIAVTYGYGTMDELKAAAPEKKAETVAELEKILLSSLI